MRQIIDGKRYNTETATLIGQGGSDWHTSLTDFCYWSAELYRTKGGRFFLAGHGGPMTMWAKSVQNGSVGGEGIIPMDADEALQWAERHLSAADVEAAFGDQV